MLYISGVCVASNDCQNAIDKLAILKLKFSLNSLTRSVVGQDIKHEATGTNKSKSAKAYTSILSQSISGACVIRISIPYLFSHILLQ